MSWYFSYHFVSCMRFSRYILFWLFYQSSEIKISFHLWSLVNPVMLNSTALLVGLTWRYFPLINTTIFHLSLCSCLYLYKKAFAYFLIDSAATYSPTPSPVQYHRPLRSLPSCSGWERVLPLSASPPKRLVISVRAGLARSNPLCVSSLVQSLIYIFGITSAFVSKLTRICASKSVHSLIDN